jgi:serine/threonine protein kinase
VSRYRILLNLGRGSTGEIFLADRGGFPSLHALLALRKIAPGVVLSAAQVGRAMAIVDPRVARTYDTDGASYIVSEYLEGPTLLALAGRARRLGPIDPCIWARIVSDVLGGLAAIHDAGALHGDVGAHQVFVGHDGRAKLSDLAIGVRKRDDLRGVSRMLWELVADRSLPEGARPDRVLPDPTLDRIVALGMHGQQTARSMREDLERWLASRGRVVLHEDVARVVTFSFAARREAERKRIRARLAELSWGAA